MIRRDTIIQSLHEIQDNSDSHWLPPGELKSLAGRYKLSGASVRGVASYYSMLSTSPRGRHVIRLCESPVCRMLGAMDLIESVAKASGAPQGGTGPDGMFTLETTQCLGRCADGPAMMVDDKVYGRLNPERITLILASIRDRNESGGQPLCPDPLIHAAQIGPGRGLTRISLRYLPMAEPSDQGEYARAGGWEGLRKALTMAPDAVVDQLSEAKVRGRGGAGFPAGIKERAAAGSACPSEEECERFVVCNADEGEPGTFKDRIIMERSPLLLIEGMIISAYAVGARHGFIYIRGEYHTAIQRVRAAIASARSAGYLGEGIGGSDFSFDLEIRIGAGSYLCGEELTLIESLEGRRGYPRIKPPFPAESGLWTRPTLVNNVETLAALPWIVEKGAGAYLALGTPSSPGTKIFCVSGDVARPGYGEWPMGVRLGELIEAAGGAVCSGGKPADRAKAILLGGAAGTFVSGKALDLAMDFDQLKNAGAVLGSGAVIVLGPGRSISACISAIMDFFKHESCGKCVPCRVGTARLAAAARRLAESEAKGMKAEPFRQGLAAMVDDADRIAKASLCPLGQSPILPLRSAACNLDYPS